MGTVDDTALLELGLFTRLHRWKERSRALYSSSIAQRRRSDIATGLVGKWTS